MDECVWSQDYMFASFLCQFLWVGTIAPVALIVQMIDAGNKHYK
jgi:hypothetical protein